MKKLFLTLLVASAMLVACGPSREERLDQIRDFEDSVFESAMGADTVVAEQLTKMYVDFADKYKTDSLAPEFLMKAAEVQSNVLHTDRAIELFDRIISDYPDFEEIPMCYYLKGNAYELNSMAPQAKEAYQVYLDKFPNHFMAESTRQMLQYVGMNPEEMLSEILNNATDDVIAVTK